MEKLRKLTQMTEHPEQYSDEEWQEIFDGETVSNEQTEAEWRSFEQQHFPQRNRLWLKIAASFIGILMISGIALAAIHLVGSQHDNSNNTNQETNTTVETPVPNELPQIAETVPQTVVFENVELEQIVDSLTYYYKVKPTYRNDAVRHLRLYFEWDQHNSIDDIASQISHFEHINISLKGDSIIIE